MLKTFQQGQLVSVADDGDTRDGIVAQVISLVKVEVAVLDAEGDAVFRMAHPKVLTPRDEEGPADEALRRVIHRGAAGGHAAPGGASGRGRRAHSRTASHRTSDR